LRYLLGAAVILMTLGVAQTASAQIVEPPPLAELSDVATVDPGVTAERGTAVQVDETQPPPETVAPQPTAPSGMSNCAEMSYYRQAAGLPARFDQIGWRESNCRNEEGVHTSCCWGYWQLNVALHLRDSRIGPKYRACGVNSRFDVDSDTPGDKMRQACAAKALYDVVGLSAWAATR
jgi:hypothetical protein